jgi:RNA polymerase sigma-70 factor (ECF subfamily)
MATSADELAWVDAAKAGDAAAFAHLVARYEARLYAASYRLLGNPDDAHDIVQETFLRAFSALGRTDDALNVGAWLHRIALNAGRDLLRRRSQRRELPWEFYANHAGESPADNPLSAVIGAEERHTVRRALEHLAPRYREALVLREFGGLSSRAIGARLGVPQETIKSLLFRSRVAFRKAYQEAVAASAMGAVGFEEARPTG